jgi:multisubunit Na+/H+ antiporter MnhG subunit
MSRLLIVIGLAIAAIGLLWPWIASLGLGRLPGDIYFQRDGFTFYAPITTGILVGVALSLVFWLFSR